MKDSLQSSYRTTWFMWGSLKCWEMGECWVSIAPKKHRAVSKAMLYPHTKGMDSVWLLSAFVMCWGSIYGRETKAASF